MFRVGAVALLRPLMLLSLMLPLFGQFAFASSVQAAQRPDGPEVVMGSTMRDFGDVFAGEELEQNFPVRNTGTKPLELAQKSTLGTRPTTPDYPVAAAVWRLSNSVVTRAVSARRAAPS